MRGPSTRSPDLLVTLNLLPKPLLEISSQELPTRLLHKTCMRNLATKSPDISGPPGKTSVKDLLKGALYKFSSQDLYERSLYKTSWNPWTTQTASRELSTKSLPKPHRDISIQDLLIPLDLLGPFTKLPTRSSQGLYERSIHKSSLQDLFTGPPYETSLYKISGYPWTS